MPLAAKYQPVLKLMEDLKVKNINTFEERGQFVIRGLANSEKDKQLILRKISQVNRDEAIDVRPEIDV